MCTRACTQLYTSTCIHTGPSLVRQRSRALSVSPSYATENQPRSTHPFRLWNERGSVATPLASMASARASPSSSRSACADLRTPAHAQLCQRHLASARRVFRPFLLATRRCTFSGAPPSTLDYANGNLQAHVRFFRHLCWQQVAARFPAHPRPRSTMPTATCKRT